MSGRNGSGRVRALALATALAGAITASGTAAAQEAIMLETIGAVRVALPDEARPIAAEPGGSRPQAQERPAREAREASAR